MYFHKCFMLLSLVPVGHIHTHSDPAVGDQATSWLALDLWIPPDAHSGQQPLGEIFQSWVSEIPDSSGSAI